VSTTWILTCSPENHASTRAHEFAAIGVKERNRRRASRVAVGDRVVLYLTGVQALAASVVVTGGLERNRDLIWLDRSGTIDIYPWRFPTRPEHVLDEAEWIEAESLVDALDHIQKWPRAHWTLAFQGQLRPLSAHDGRVLGERLEAAAVVAAGS
jgi:hypothetical protein